MLVWHYVSTLKHFLCATNKILMTVCRLVKKCMCNLVFCLELSKCIIYPHAVFCSVSYGLFSPYTSCSVLREIRGKPKDDNLCKNAFWSSVEAWVLSRVASKVFFVLNSLLVFLQTAWRDSSCYCWDKTQAEDFAVLFSDIFTQFKGSRFETGFTSLPRWKEGTITQHSYHMRGLY